MHERPVNPDPQYIGKSDAELREVITRANEELARRQVERWRADQLAGPTKDKK
jgi:hypothetical protein